MSKSSFSIVLDMEATGLDPLKARPIEVGLCLVDSNTWDPVCATHRVIFEPDYASLQQEITDITGITQDELFTGISLVRALAEFAEKIGDKLPLVDFVVAYNRDYDEVLYRTEAGRVLCGLTPLGKLMLDLPWLCAMRDVEENYKHKCWKLAHLALDHGVAVDPANLHRAMADVELTMKLLSRVGTTAEKMHTFQKVPWVAVQALIPAPFQDGGKGRDLAVKAGYSWQKARGSDRVFEKAWVKLVKEHLVEKELSSVPFKARQIGGVNG